MVDWAGLIDDAEVRAVPSAGALPSWGGRERVSDVLSVAGPASVPRSLGCPHERHRSGWAAAAECAIATPNEKAPPAGAGGANVISAMSALGSSTQPIWHGVVRERLH